MWWSSKRSTSPIYTYSPQSPISKRSSRQWPSRLKCPKYLKPRFNHCCWSSRVSWHSARIITNQKAWVAEWVRRHRPRLRPRSLKSRWWYPPWKRRISTFRLNHGLSSARSPSCLCRVTSKIQLNNNRALNRALHWARNVSHKWRFIRKNLKFPKPKFLPKCWSNKKLCLNLTWRFHCSQTNKKP